MEGDWAVPDQQQAAAPAPHPHAGAAPRRRPPRAGNAPPTPPACPAGTVCGILVAVRASSRRCCPKAKGKTGAAPLPTEDPAAPAWWPPCPTRAQGDSGSQNAQALNWGTVGPQRQTADTGYTYTALPAKPAALPEFGRVDTSWFADAAFLGDSLTAGFCVNEYNIDVGGALVCGYEGISPNTVVNRTTVTSPDRGEEVPLDVLAAAQPAKLYILIGTNALVQPGNDDSFLAYYGKMLDDLRTALPNTAFYVQSVLTATQEKVSDRLPGLAPDRLAVINAAIQQLCAERGCYYLDLNAEFADDAGYLQTDFPARRRTPDGVRLQQVGQLPLHPLSHTARTTPIRPEAPTI